MLEELFRGLQADRSATILIEGHTSSEGTEVHPMLGLCRMDLTGLNPSLLELLLREIRCGKRPIEIATWKPSES